MRNRKAAEEVLFQRRILAIICVIVVISIFIWIFAIATPNWHEVDGGRGLYVPKTRRYFLHSNAGIWKFCRNSYPDNHKPTTQSCKYRIKNERFYFVQYK